MLQPTDWEDLTGIRIEQSDAFSQFSYECVVTIYKGDKLVLPDMAPSILEICKFPKLLCKMARLTAADGKVRTIHADGTVTAKTPLYIPPPKPKLIIPEPKIKPKLILPEED
jgi:hypothetical protein